MTTAETDAAKKLLEQNGFVVLREKSYRQAQERQRVAEALREAAEDRTRSVEAWARNNITEERRLADRLTFVYGVARSHGATVDELAGPETDREQKVKLEAEQRVSDLQAEFFRAERIRDRSAVKQVDRLRSSLALFVESSSDPGAEALGALQCAEQWLSRTRQATSDG